MRKTFFVTGGTGYLGRNCIPKMLDHSWDPVLLVRPTSDLSTFDGQLDIIRALNIEGDLEKGFRDYRPEGILHMATNYGKGSASLEEVLQTNLNFPVQLLELAKKYNVKQFINIDTNLPENTSPYALSKKQFLKWLRLFSRDFKCVNIGLEYFYGPLDGSKKFITMVIRTILAGKDRLALTAGEQRRDFIFIDDAVDAILTIMNQQDTGQDSWQEFEVGSGETVSLKELVTFIAQSIPECKTQFGFGDLPYRENELMESKADLSAISSLGWAPKYSLKEGLQKTVAEESRNHVKVAS